MCFVTTIYVPGRPESEAQALAGSAGSSGGSQGGSALCLSRLLGLLSVLGVPGRVVGSLQSLPPAPHGLPGCSSLSGSQFPLLERTGHWMGAHLTPV